MKLKKESNKDIYYFNDNVYNCHVPDNLNFVMLISILIKECLQVMAREI